MFQETQSLLLAGTVLLEARTPVAVDIMDADFDYSTAVISSIIKHAKDHGYEVDEVRVRFGTIVKLKNDGNRKADSTTLFRIISLGEKLVAEYITDSTIM